uniref:Uncharacterized protein n=1 Tax=Arundo donax TaxID=35708 RepID=A0A0A8ZRT5_ARUDO
MAVCLSCLHQYSVGQTCHQRLDHGTPTHFI